MTSRRSRSETRRSVEETADELERLRTDIDRRIAPQEIARYKARASKLRAEAIRHFMRLAAAPDGEEDDAPVRG